MTELRKVGDRKPALSGTAVDGTAGVDLTGRDLTVHVWWADRGASPTSLPIVRPAVPANQTTSPGGWSMEFAADDLAKAGRYGVHLVLDSGTALQQTLGPEFFTVLPETPRLP